MSIFCSNINSYEIKRTIIKNSNSNYTFQLPPDLILPSQIFIIVYKSGFEGVSWINPDSGEMVILSQIYILFLNSWEILLILKRVFILMA